MGRADIDRMRRNLLALFVCLLAAAPSVSADPLVPTPDDGSLATTDLFHLHVTVTAEGDTQDYGDEWFSPGSGAFNAVVPGGFALSNDTHVAYTFDEHRVERVVGSAAFLKAVSQPTILQPGAASLFAYLEGEQDDELSSDVVDGRLVLRVDTQPQENSDEVVTFESTVLERVTQAEAEARQLFVTPKSTSTLTERRVGQRAGNGVHAWWLGRRHGGHPAVTAVELTSRTATWDGFTRSYTTVYQDTHGTSLDPRDDLWPSWPGFGNLDRDELLVESIPLGSRLRGLDRRTVRRRAFRLADGSTGRLLSSPHLYGTWVQTRDALVELSGPGLDDEHPLAAARLLRPVG